MTETTAGALFDYLAAITADQRILGGCDDCDAEQQVIQAKPRIWVLKVFHDDDCPYLNKGTQ